MPEKVREQIIAVCETGKTNMFDTRTVQTIARCMGFHELYRFIEEHRAEYANFILHGDGRD